MKSDTKTKGPGTKAWTSVSPFHLDHSQQTQYYSELDVQPPYDSYVVDLPDGRGRSNRIWTVRLGDLVVLHCERSAGKATYATKEFDKSQTKTYFPFWVPWAVGEVVTIMKEVETTSGTELIRLEIRWFYREAELPGKTHNTPKCHLESEEIYESDHYSDIEPSSLLAPVELHDHARPVLPGKSQLGMPIVEFYCKRFWSAYRKSLVPSSGLEGRIARGRAYSRCIANDAALKASLTRISPTKPTSRPSLGAFEFDQSSSAPWNRAFRQVIHKLSLTDASKEAYNNGAALIGREKERYQIKSFLRASISGKLDNNNKASIFVAGPPGVG
jgi:hypothetical protein